MRADPTFKENLASTVEDLLAMNVVPVFNENDAISKGVVKATVSCVFEVSKKVFNKRVLAFLSGCLHMCQMTTCESA